MRSVKCVNLKYLGQPFFNGNYEDNINNTTLNLTTLHSYIAPLMGGSYCQRCWTIKKKYFITRSNASKVTTIPEHHAMEACR